MDIHIMFVLVLVIGTLSQVDSYRADFIPAMPMAGAVRQAPAHVIQQQQKGCDFTTVANPNYNQKNGSSSAIYPPFLQQRTRANSYSLDCHVRTLNQEFWSNYTFNRDQLEFTSRLNVQCNDKLFFDSFLEPSFFRLRNLHEVSFHKCKIRKIPTRVWSGLGLLKSLTISSFNSEWSAGVGMDIEMGAFEGLPNLEKLDLSQNNIWAIHDKNVFCPLRSLLKLNMSRNRLSDLEELGFGSSSTFRLSNSEESGGIISSGSCVMNIQNLDFSHNSVRRLNSNAFNRLRKLSELRLHNNLIEELDDTSFQGLSQLRLLNLSSNRLVALPPTIFKALAVREINLSNNSISALSPQVFSGLTTLLSLDLSQNSLTSMWVRESIFSGLVRLVVLKLSHNKLTYVDATIFSDLPSLRALHLDNNRIENLNPSAFQNLKNLESLDLSNNRLTLIDSRHFANLFKLKRLYLDHNEIREMDDNSLKNCTYLEDLGLADNKLTQVPVALPPTLVTLDIGENRISSVNGSFNLPQVYGLRLVDNVITELPTGFCESMKNLRVLNVAQNRINKIASGAFSACPHVRALRLDSNLLEDLIPLTLADQMPSLLWLNISENNLKYADYKLLPPTLEWLDVSHNQLESIGGPVTDGGKDTVTYSLRVLDASHNKLTNLDYTTIPPTLETLRVNYNRLKQVAPDTFTRSSRLRRVELAGNEIENLSLASIRFPQIPLGKPLPEFYIGKNPFVCDCKMEWLTRVNQLSVLRQHPRIVDLDAIVCRFSRTNQLVPLVETKPKDFLCPYKSHCFALCQCCEFDACDCKMTCPTNCTCYHDTAWSANIVQCSNLEFSQTPASIPMDATEVYLDGNRMPELGNHIFIGKKNLRALHLNGSQIETIKNKTFNGLKSLEVLRLNDNKLTEINGEFTDLESLAELYLQDNLIRFINLNAFSGLKFLRVLRLDGNMLVNFQVWTLSNNRYLNSVMLANNPWSCECEFLIPFRTWAASKTAILDFTSTTCQPLAVDTVGSNTTDNFYGEDSASHSDKLSVQPQLIMNMCDHNKELNFNFNPNNENSNNPAFLDSGLLNNQISAEKVASSPDDDNMNIYMGNGDHTGSHHHTPANDISVAEDQTVEQKESGNGMLTIVTSVLIVLIIVLLIIVYYFRSQLPFCLYSWINSASCCLCGGGSGEDDDEESGASCGSNHHRGGFLASLFQCCCGGSGKVGKKSRSSSIDDADKLFDAYFLYSRKDEDLLLKIAPELEGPSSGYSSAGATTIPPPPPPHHGAGNSGFYRLCLHYRDLPCLSAENSFDMISSACDASKRVVVVISRPFLQNELSHPGFRQAISTAINRYQNKLIFILLPPFTEQSLHTIYPELKAGHFTPMTMTKGAETLAHSSGNSQITSLEWSDKNFWSKLKLILPTPTVLASASSPSGLNSTSTISSTGSSAIFNMAPAYHPHHHNLINYNNALSLHEYAYNTINSQHHQYHRNILPFNGTTPPVPKHHIALTTPAWQQQQQQLQNQNFYNNSQHSQIIPIPGYPSGTASTALPTSGVGANTPLMMQNAFHHPAQNMPSFNESFRRHLQLQQTQNKMMTAPHHHHQHHLSNCSSTSQGHNAHHHHHHHHQGSHCSSSHSSSTSNNNPSIHPYQPLDANYSSSSSNEELLDHVYSTLDSPPIISENNNHGCESSSELISKQVNNGNAASVEQVDNSENSCSSRISPPLQNRLNNNSANCPVANNSNSSGSQPNPASAQNTNGTNNNGTMYFV